MEAGCICIRLFAAGNYADIVCTNYFRVTLLKGIYRQWYIHRALFLYKKPSGWGVAA